VNLAAAALTGYKATIPKAGKVRGYIRLTKAGYLDQVADALLAFGKLFKNDEPTLIGKATK
jgi:hypothetical protein